MPESPKRRGFVYRHLVRRPARYFVAGLAVAAARFRRRHRGIARRFTPGGKVAETGRGRIPGGAVLPVRVRCLGTGGIGLAAYSLWSALTIFDRHPDVTYLGRYGPQRQVAAAVDAEMADWKNVLQIGHRLRSFRIYASGRGSDYSAEVYLTLNWIICISNTEADRLTIFRTDDLVVATRIPAPPTSFLPRPQSARLGHAGRPLRHPRRTAVPGSRRDASFGRNPRPRSVGRQPVRPDAAARAGGRPRPLRRRGRPTT